MSARGFLPLVLGGGLAYWAYTKKDEEPKEEPEEGDPLQELAREAARMREAQAKAEAAKANPEEPPKKG